MSSLWWILILVGALTVLGSAALLFVTVKYYWGERGGPPKTGAERKQQHKQELKLRAQQIKYADSHPVEKRRTGFFDNRKN